jgi:bacillithiol biosynthesis deacetylase BshB1
MTSRLDLLVIGAHPDDAEIGMGGTIVKHARAGLRVGVCDLTKAEMSSNGDVETRSREAADASRLLGLAYRSNLGLPDRGLSLAKEHIDAVVREIRRLRPRVVFAPHWEDRHPDHVMCSRIVQEAVFSAKLRRYLPELPAWTVRETYFYYINGVDAPDVLVDISAVQPVKMEALACYRSQFEEPSSEANRVPTPLNQGYLERVAARDRLFGQLRSVAYAEGFASRVPLLIDRFGMEE